MTDYRLVPVEPTADMTDLIKRLRIKAGMIELGERIPWGSDSALMREAADVLERAGSTPAVQQSAVCGYLINDGFKEQFVKTLSDENRKTAQRFNWTVTAVCHCPGYESAQGGE